MSQKICPRAKTEPLAPVLLCVWLCVCVFRSGWVSVLLFSSVSWGLNQVAEMFSLFPSSCTLSSLRPQCSQSLSLSKRQEAALGHKLFLRQVQLSTLSATHKLTHSLKLHRWINHVTARNNNRNCSSMKYLSNDEIVGCTSVISWVKDWIRAHWQDTDLLGQSRNFYHFTVSIQVSVFSSDCVLLLYCVTQHINCPDATITSIVGLLNWYSCCRALYFL